MSDALDTMGPIDYLVVEFPTNKGTGEAMPLLLDLVDRGIVRVLDITFVTKDADGSWRSLAVEELGGGARDDFAVFEGASSGLVGEEDISEVAEILTPGSSAGILVYENLWAAPFAAALRRNGAQLIASDRIPVQALLAAVSS